MKINPINNVSNTITRITKTRKVTFDSYPQFHMITEKEHDKPYTLVKFFKKFCDAVKYWNIKIEE